VVSPLVSIGVATYKRPEGLRRLLQGIAGLEFRRLPRPAIEVVVVDNEARGAAALVCREFPSVGMHLRWCEEPRRGITYARNRCLQEARPDSEWIAFIDDDEVPDPGWLEALLQAQQRHAADVVTGPVVPVFEGPVPEWVVRGGFFEPRGYPDGSLREVAFTNNVLMRAALPAELKLAFDDRLALTGGEDTDFFMRARRAGARLVWAADAVVRETVPAQRTRAAWILRRGFREWGSHSYSERRLDPAPGTRIVRVLKATALVAAGCASLPVTALLGRHRSVRSLLLVARGAGSLAGLLGTQYAEYRDAGDPPRPSA
jgi:glycosyltransferase involved in cell wall biosynthesis